MPLPDFRNVPPVACCATSCILALVALLVLLVQRSDFSSSIGLSSISLSQQQTRVPRQCNRHSDAWSRSLQTFLAPLASTAQFSSEDFEREATKYILSKSNMVVPVAIRDGNITVLRHSLGHFGWLLSMVDELIAANQLSPLPDAFFLMSSYAWPLRTLLENNNVLMLAVNSGDSHSDIPVPGGQFTKELDGLYAGDTPGPPWRERKPMAVWRGSLMCSSWYLCHTRCPRLQIRLASQLRPELLDVRFTNFAVSDLEYVAKCEGDTMVATARADHANGSTLDFAAQTQYQFTIASDGHSYSSGYKQFLASGSVVLRQRSNYLEFFEPALIPYVHVVPFDCRDAKAGDCELVQLLESAKSEAAANRWAAIASAGRTFAATHMGPEGRACYWHMLLDQLSSPRYFRGGATLPADVVERLASVAAAVK
jgi:hypothetical protein